MEVTNQQFQEFIRMSLSYLKKALEESPDNEALRELYEIFRSMLEDGTDRKL